MVEIRCSSAIYKSIITMHEGNFTAQQFSFSKKKSLLVKTRFVVTQRIVVLSYYFKFGPNLRTLAFTDGSV